MSVYLAHIRAQNLKHVSELIRRRRRLSLLLPLIMLTGSASAWNFNFGTFGLDEDLILFHDFGTDFNEERTF